MRKFLHVTLLCLLNVINYTDRYTFGGILPVVKSEFDINNDMAGLLQSCSIIAYTVSAPIWGYFGDRFSRNILLSLCVILWSCAHLGSSFATIYTLVVLGRILVGVGQSGFTTVAPTIFSDFFIGDKRLRLLALFYMGVPVGNGVAIALSSEMYKITGSWVWCLRVTPAISLAMAIIIMLLKEPERGFVEGRSHDVPTSIGTDLKYLAKNRSYITSTLAYTCLSFSTGVIYYWGPHLYYVGFSITRRSSNDNVVTHVGVLSIFSGVLGLSLGYCMSHLLKSKCSSTDPLICAAGLFFAAPMFMASTFVTDNTLGLYVLIFLGQVGVNVNWAISCDILLNVVTPRRRALACGLQGFVCHALGDAGSPFLFGFISVKLETFFKEEYPDAGMLRWEFWALQHSYFLPIGMLFVGGGLYAATSIFLVGDTVAVNTPSEADVTTTENEER